MSGFGNKAKLLIGYLIIDAKHKKSQPESASHKSRYGGPCDRHNPQIWPKLPRFFLHVTLYCGEKTVAHDAVTAL